MKKLISIFFVAIFVFTISACGTTEESPSEYTNDNGQIETDINDGNILIAYFSYLDNTVAENITSDQYDAVTSASIQIQDGERVGNNAVLAEYISKQTGGDIFSILTEDAYPADYDDTVDLGSQELGDNARPELASHIDNIDDYQTVYIIYPNWWGDMPMALYSFFEEYDFSGKTIIPCVSSAGSGFSDTINSIEELEPDANILQGFSILDDEIGEAENVIDGWLEETKHTN